MNPPTDSPPIHDFSIIAAAAEAAAKPAPTLPKIFVAVCSSDWRMEVYTAESIRALANVCPCEVVVRYMLNDGVARSRNNLAAMALETDCTHVYFHDSDILIEPRQFAMYLEAIADGKKIVGGFYPKKQGILDWVVNFAGDATLDEKRRIRLKHAGTGSLMIAREVFEHQIEHHPEIHYRGDPSPTSQRWDFFPMGAKNGLYESEDWAFCNRALADGFEIWGLTECQLRHVGKIVYPLQFTLSDDEVVDIVNHRYGIPHDEITGFIASGTKPPGLMGGHREGQVKLWPKDYPVDDLFEGGILAGSLDLPIGPGPDEPPPRIVDLTAGYGSFLRFALSRWRGASFEGFEADPAIFPFLEKTTAGVNPEVAKTAVECKAFDVSNAAEIPECEILRTSGDDAGPILFVLAGLGRTAAMDGIIVTASSLAAATVAAEAVAATHELVSLQRAANGAITLKLISRRLRLVQNG